MGVNDNRRDALEALIEGSIPRSRQKALRMAGHGEYYVIALSDGWYPPAELSKALKSAWRNFTARHVYVDKGNPKPGPWAPGERWPWATDTTVFRGRLLGPDTPHSNLPWPCKNFLVELLGAAASAPTAAELLINETTVNSHTLFLWNSNTHKPRIGDIFRVKLTPDESTFGFNLAHGQALEFYSSTGKSVMENWSNTTSTTVEALALRPGCDSLEDLFDYYEEAAEGGYPCIFRGPDSKYGKCIEGQGSREWEFPTVINPSTETSVSMNITQGVVDLTKKIFKTDTADNVAILLAIRTTEAGSKGPTAFRFEPHKFLTHYPAGDIPYLPSDPEVLDDEKSYPSTDKHEQGERETRGAGRKTSGYIPGNGSHVRVTAFSRAYDQNRIAAIKATSWGAYQVLGEYLDPEENENLESAKIDDRIKNALASDEDAQVFLDLFNSDPQTVSDDLLVVWFSLSDKDKAAEYALKKDWNRFALEYNGLNCCKYTESWWAQKKASSEQKTFNVLRVDENTGEEVIEVARDELHRSDLVEHPGKHGAYPETFAENYEKATRVAAASKVSSLVTG